MPHTRKHARRLLSELTPRLPDEAKRVLESPSYWDPGFYQLFFEFVENLVFREPKAGLRVARVLPQLASSLPEGDCPDERRAHRDRKIRAHSLLGSALRVAERLDAAEQQFRKAFRLSGRDCASRTALADLYWRWAALRASQKRFDSALRLAGKAERIFKNRGDREGQWAALAARGATLACAKRFSEAVSVLGELLGGHKLPPRIECAATHNLAYAVSQAKRPNLDSALGYLHRARQLLGPRRSVQKARIYWIEGTIFLRRGSAFAERGERRYLKALQGFLKFQAPYDIALVSLDLSALYRFQKRWPELEELAADTYRRFRELQEDTEALAALKLWSDAARMRTLSDEVISDVKAKLEEQARRHPAAAVARRRAGPKSFPEGGASS